MTTRARALLALALLAAAPAAAQQGAAVSGRVVDAASGAPVAGAVVRVDGAAAAARTDSAGRWTVDRWTAGANAERVAIRVAAAGYVGRTVDVRVPSSEVRIALRPAPLALNAVVVTASRREQRLADVPVATEVIGRGRIEQTGATDLASVLSQGTGIQPEGGQPTGSGVMLQGLGSERVLLLMDGQPVIGRLSGELDFSRIPTSMIQRVEVVKGPQSTLYGSEAMGGVINVITRPVPAGGWTARAGVTGGSQGRTDVDAGASAARGAFRGGVDATRRLVQAAPGVEEARGARAEQRDAQARLRWSPDSAVAVDAAVLVLDEGQRWTEGQLYHFADNREWNARLGGRAVLGGQTLTPTLSFSSYSHVARSATGPTPVDGSGDRERQSLARAELLYSGRVAGTVLDAGAVAAREWVNSDRVEGTSRTRDLAEPFAQLTWQGARWSVVPGARLAWREQWGAFWVPRLAAMYRPVGPLALRASVGRGFRAPSFKEQYLEWLNLSGSFAYAVRGNPGLRPETSTNATVGAEWAGSRVYLRAQAYENRLHDFIETRLVGDSGGITLYTYGNVARGFTRGAELDAGADLGPVRADAGYAWLRAEQRGTDTPLLGRPAHSAHLGLDHALPLGARVHWLAEYTGRAPESLDVETGAVRYRDAYLRFDARIARDLPGGLRLSAGADNLLGAHPAGWPELTGRHVYLGLAWAAGSPGA